MYAIVRETNYHPRALEQGQKELNEFHTLHASQAGYAGTVVVDLGAGRWLSVNLWETPEAAREALRAMVPAVQRLLEPMIDGPSATLGAGSVVLTDLKRA